MEKIDFKKEWKHLYKPSKEVQEVQVPAMQFLMVDGHGDPNCAPAYKEAIEALYSVSYTLKFAVKKTGTDYVVMPLEGLWWADDPTVFQTGERDKWQWTMMIMQPEFVTASMVKDAIATVKEKKGFPGLDKLRFETFEEGLAAQVMHIGPFTEEGPTIERVHAFIAEHGALTGKHHEIYLSDIRRANPANWKTVIRQPMHKA